MNTTPRLDSWSLRTRVSLLLTALAGVLVVALAGLWLRQTQESVREEVAAATRVAEQWLRVTARARGAGPQDDARLLADIRALGRIRANALEVLDGAGQRRYLSPPSRYKAGRAAPAWFGAAVEPRFAARRIAAGELTLVLRPDASRATLDAWDELCAMAGWAVAMLAALFLAACYALDRALRPLGQVMAALDRTGQGRFDTRLPAIGSTMPTCFPARAAAARRRAPGSLRARSTVKRLRSPTPAASARAAAISPVADREAWMSSSEAFL